jgi:hypothetical protein
MSRWLTARVLNATAALLAALALLLAVWPARGDVPAAALKLPAVTTSAPPASLPAAERESMAAQIVATNLFSPTRRAPRSRFVPPGQEIMADAPPVGVSDVASTPLQLLAIMSVDGVTRALVQPDDADSTPRLVGVGERVGRYRLLRIGADRIELTSSSGTRIVRLSRKTPADSSETPAP